MGDAGVIRFDYLRNRAPDALDWFRSREIARPLQAPLAAVATALLVVLAAFGIETYRADQARSVERLAQMRVEQSRADLAKTTLERTDIDALLALDRRLRGIRLSGSLLAQRLADIANHVPGRAWLSGISPTSNGISISGHAEDLGALSETIADLMSSKTVRSPSLVRAGKDDLSQGKPDLLSFEMRVEDGPK